MTLNKIIAKTKLTVDTDAQARCSLSSDRDAGAEDGADPGEDDGTDDDGVAEQRGHFIPLTAS